MDPLSTKNKIVIMSWGLPEIREGSLNAERLISIKPVKNSAFSECAKKLELKAGRKDGINIPDGIPPQFSNSVNLTHWIQTRSN